MEKKLLLNCVPYREIAISFTQLLGWLVFRGKETNRSLEVLRTIFTLAIIGLWKEWSKFLFVS